MSSVTRPRGPLPPRVYWVRRLVVLSVALLLVVGLARLLGAGSDGRQDAPASDTAVRAGAQAQESTGDEPTDLATDSTPSAGSTAGSGDTTRPGRPGRPGAGPAQPTVARPDGACSDDEVVVTPVIQSAVGGTDVVIRLEITSDDSAACTFPVSSDTVSVKVVSGGDFIWSTQQCPRSVPRIDVIPRARIPAVVHVVWAGRRSDAACSRGLAWALPGYYHAIGAAFGGEVTDVQFRLLGVPGSAVTRTADPTDSPSAPTSGATRRPGARPSKLPVVRPSGLPSSSLGAVVPGDPQ